MAASLKHLGTRYVLEYFLALYILSVELRLYKNLDQLSGLPEVNVFNIAGNSIMNLSLLRVSTK